MKEAVFLRLQNSYIFLQNKNKEYNKKSTEDGVIILNIGKNVSDYLMVSFPNVDTREENCNPFKKEYIYDYSICQESYKIGQLNKAVIKAIKITEDKEFAEKNSMHILSAMSKLSETLKEFTQNITQTISKNMAMTLQTLETEFASFSENVKETYTKSGSQ